MEKEKELLLKFKPIFETFLHRTDLQVVALYALQATWFAMDCPKGKHLFKYLVFFTVPFLEEFSNLVELGIGSPKLMTHV